MYSYYSKITPQVTIFMSFSYICLPCREFAGKFRSILFVIDFQWKANKKVGFLASQWTPTLQSWTATYFARYLFFLIHRNCLNAECQPASSYRACKSRPFLVFTVNIAVSPQLSWCQKPSKDRNTISFKEKRRNTTHNLLCECELQLQNFTYLKIALVVVWSKMVKTHRTVLGFR